MDGPEGENPVFRPRKVRFGKVIEFSIKGCTHVEFCRHALDRMEQRSISEDEVLKAIRSPNGRQRSTEPGKLRLRKFRNADKTEAIDVVYLIDKPRFVIVTVIALKF